MFVSNAAHTDNRPKEGTWATTAIINLSVDAKIPTECRNWNIRCVAFPPIETYRHANDYRHDPDG